MGNQKKVFDFFDWGISRTVGDKSFSKQCDSDVTWTHVTIATMVVESDFRKSNKSRFKSFLSNFLTGRKPLLLWSF